jgi:oxepin-CoA hydrolase/3-oxo-5,6-dehydrosuberyl-CoA semialdehyde dehydrogenase
MARFDVNDEDLRDSFLRDEFLGAMATLGADAVAQWGRMRPQEMVEHLAWTFRVSKGVEVTGCATPDADLPRFRRFLYSNRPMPREFMNPVLVGGLPPLRHASLSDAKADLEREVTTFLDGPRDPDGLHMHPTFGAIGYEDWHRAHYKHAYHHLLQFALIEPE